MAITDGEFESILNDGTKVIEGDLSWEEDEDHSPSLQFRAVVSSELGWQLVVVGSHNPLAIRTSYHLIYRQAERIYGLDLGKQHRNPGGELVGEKHKHIWREATADKYAYEPADITAPANDPVGVWVQFCEEAKLVHNGTLAPVPAQQQELFP
jgi:hypothetical protein